ncbi:MAG: hypothetical protein HY662_02890, partial [Chloroflexi bacterium]|nr:hypothetical protein [Chloroflexota bacterium]
MAESRVRMATLVLSCLLSLASAALPASPTIAAAPEEAKWSRVNIPADDETGSWALASGADVRHPIMTSDGTIYAHAKPSATSSTLFKSVDGGFSWASQTRVKDDIVALASDPRNAANVYYATSANVYKSTDGGASFQLLPPKPGGAGSNNISITSLAVSHLDNRNIVAIGTKDGDNGQYGGVYTLDEDVPLPGWTDTDIGNYDVADIAFSPDFTTDRQLFAVATDETDTLVITRIADIDWGKIIGDARIKSLIPKSAVIVFPNSHNASYGNYSLFLAINAGGDNGDVYRVDGQQVPSSSIATDLNIGAAYNLSGVDVTGLAVSGNATTTRFLAGAANSTQVYTSADGGTNWTRSRKEPTGQSETYLVMAPDFVNSGIAYAATSGAESAFSRTSDGGMTWNQIGLVDARISLNGIVDLAVSPEYDSDGTLFLLTFNGTNAEHSLWRSSTDGDRWERVLNTTLAGADSLNRVALSPRYSPGSQVVFLSGTRNGDSAIWKSSDNGQNFTPYVAPFPIDTWVLANNDTLFLGSFDGSTGIVYRTDNGGFFYSEGAVAGSQPIKSIALSPAFEQDKTVLVGNTNGRVYWSEDNGDSFKSLPLDVTSSPLNGEVVVAFDTQFAKNRVIYAASATADKGIYRFVVNKSTQWERIDASLPAGGLLGPILVSVDGTIYAANAQAVNNANKKGGIERSLNPTFSLGPGFETVTRGLDDGVTLFGLWRHGNQLWSIDTKNTRLVTYPDSLTTSVTLTAPLNEVIGVNTNRPRLEWGTLKGAIRYQWQLNDEADFSAVPVGFDGETQSTSVRLPVLEPATRYYWRVRAIAPTLSRWSPTYSFSTVIS